MSNKLHAVERELIERVIAEGDCPTAIAVALNGGSIQALGDNCTMCDLVWPLVLDDGQPIAAIPLRDALDWLMVSDPTPLAPEQDDRVHDAIDAACKVAGFDGWVDAYHQLDKTPVES